ncbi:hypothetical protein GCM10023212_20490 [Luteolibacter yonseiensis]
MKKILFYIEPVVFRNDPLLLAPHLDWAGQMCKNLSLRETDELVIVSSAAMAEAAKLRLGESVFGIRALHVCPSKALDAFGGERYGYARDLYSLPGVPARNLYLSALIRSAFEEFDPDLVISTAENRYISSAVKDMPRRVGTFFIEKLPLPYEVRRGRFYLDPVGHQVNGLIASRWSGIIKGEIRDEYTVEELDAAGKLIADLTESGRSQESAGLRELFRTSLPDPDRETIMVALQPDEWISWEGALSSPLKPMDILLRCCAKFPEFNIIPTFHGDMGGIRDDLLKHIKMIHPNVVDLPAHLLMASTSKLLPVVDHVYSVSSATGITALLGSKNLICDARSYLSPGSVTTAGFLAGERKNLTDAQKVNLAAFLGRYGKTASMLRSYKDYRDHRKGTRIKNTGNPQPRESLGRRGRWHGLSKWLLNLSSRGGGRTPE